MDIRPRHQPNQIARLQYYPQVSPLTELHKIKISSFKFLFYNSTLMQDPCCTYATLIKSLYQVNSKWTSAHSDPHSIIPNAVPQLSLCNAYRVPVRGEFKVNISPFCLHFLHGFLQRILFSCCTTNLLKSERQLGHAHIIQKDLSSMKNGYDIMNMSSMFAML